MNGEVGDRDVDGDGDGRGTRVLVLVNADDWETVSVESDAARGCDEDDALDLLLVLDSDTTLLCGPF